MCGIAGVSLNTDKNVAGHGVALFKNLLVENTKRGKDSTGIVYQYKNGTEIYRGLLPGVDAKEFILPASDIIGFLGHTRYATVGNKLDYDNVHPFETEKYIGVHNGTIFNHKLLKAHFNLETEGQCDSEVLYKLLDKFGLDGLKFVEGLYMLVYIHKDRPEELNLITNGTKPMLLLKLHGELVAFGSVGEDTQDRATKYWDKLKKKYDFEPIKPCTLYRLKNGKIVERRDLSSKIKYMSEKEGELRYKVDYKVLKKDFYQMALPMSRRLMEPEPEKKKATAATTSNKRSVWGNNTRQTTIFGESYLCRSVNADPTVVAWAMEHVGNFFKMTNSRMVPPIRGTENVFMSVETLGMPVHFSTKKGMNAFVCNELYGVKPTDSVNISKLELKNPLVSVFPGDVGINRVWLPASIQVTQLLNAMVFSDETTLYSKYDWVDSMPKASSLIAASLCNMLNIQQLKEIESYIIEELVENKILNNKIKIVNSIEEKKEFEELAKEEETVVFSKKNPMLKHFVNRHYRDETWFSPSAVRGALEKLGTTVSFTAEDLGATGRGFFMSELMIRLCERIALDGGRIYTPKSTVPYNKLDDVAKMLHKASTDRKAKDIQDFMSRGIDLSKTDFADRYNNDLDSFEAATKEQIKCYFGNIYVAGSPMFLDLPSLVNNINNKKQTLRVMKQVIHRVRLLHDFVVYGITPDLDGPEYITVNLKE